MNHQQFDDCEEILELINEIEEDYPDIYERGEDFLVDVKAKVESVQQFIQERGEATPGQLRALGNWRKGVANWHPKEK